jgi:serine/threonine-protein phosphatase 5
MASEESSEATTSQPSAADTSVGSSAAGAADTDEPPLQEVIQHGKEGEEKAIKLKDEGNEQLLAGHFLQAIGLYSEALEFAPTNAIILSNRAQAYIKVENYGLAIADATAAIESDETYAKAYYRRGSAQFALSHYKDARKDFKKVCQLKPKDRDARAKYQACDKAVKQAAFLKAIESENTAPLSSTYDPSAFAIPSSYDGPHPHADGLTDDMDLEASLFEPGNLPREFVMVS